MKTRIIPLVLAVGVGASFLNAQDDGPPADGPRPPSLERGHTGFRVHVLPPGARERLSLTPQQKEEIAAVEADVKARLEKILTPDQVRELQTMRPPRPQGGPPPPPPLGD
jgi:hypothetical protein